MRPGPATRTAFACVNSPPPYPRSGQLLCRDAAEQRPFNADLDRGALRTRRCDAAHRASQLQSRFARPFSEEAATPGYPQRLHALGTTRQFTLVNCRRTSLARLLAA